MTRPTGCPHCGRLLAGAKQHCQSKTCTWTTCMCGATVSAGGHIHARHGFADDKCLTPSQWRTLK